MNETLKQAVTAVIALIMIMVAAAPAVAQDEAEQEAPQSFRERFTARAISMGTSNPPVIPPGRTAVIDINVTRWTTPEERQSLFDTLAEGGSREFNRALRRQDETGWLRVTGPSQSGRTNTFPSERIRYARQIVGEDGQRRLILGLARPVTMYESRNRPRWRNHDISLMVFDLDAEGNGAGQFAVGVQMAFDSESGTLTIENFGTEPVRLTSVRQENR